MLVKPLELEAMLDMASKVTYWNKALETDHFTLYSGTADNRSILIDRKPDFSDKFGLGKDTYTISVIPNGPDDIHGTHQGNDESLVDFFKAIKTYPKIK